MKMTFGAALVAAAFLATPSYAATLVQYEFTGSPGTQTSNAAINVATGVTGQVFTRGAGLGTNVGAGSINSNGFNGQATDFLTFGLNFATGFTGSVNQLLIGTQSSGTGPGTINLLASVDNGLFNTIATFTQDPATALSQSVLFGPLSASSSIVFRLAAANQISASGGAVSTTGTFRVQDYQTSTPVTINGTVTALAAAVPEPATWGMMILGFGLAGSTMRRRQKVRTTVAFA